LKWLPLAVLLELTRSLRCGAIQTQLSMRLKKENETNFHTVDTKGGPILVLYVVRRSNRSRRISIRVDSDHQALLTIPRRASMKEALSFFGQCGDWIVKQTKKITRPKSLLEYLSDNPNLSLNGAMCSVTFALTNRCPFCEYHSDSSQVVLRFDPQVVQEARIMEALKKLANQCLAERLFFLCKAKRIVAPARVTVRNQSSRWGSCSTSRAISLNWRLILLPTDLQDYVILHELAHLRQMNHSRSFWKLLGSYDPNTKDNDKRLSIVGRPIIGLGKMEE
jgi:predicted metal-dependent hydrolase